MKRSRIYALLLLAWTCSLARAQTFGPFPVTSTASSSCARAPISNATSSTVHVIVTGTFSATLQVSLALNGNVNVTNVVPLGSTSSSSQTTITAAGDYGVMGTAGHDTVLVCATIYASGTPVVTFGVSTGVSSELFGGGGGGGTNNPGGSAGQIQVNGGSVFTGITASGDATINTSTGVVTVAGANGGTFPASATVLGTNSSKQPIAATTSGTGSTVALTTSPTFVTPALGTPASGVLTNATGYLWNNNANATGNLNLSNGANTTTINSHFTSGTNNAFTITESSASAGSGGFLMNLAALQSTVIGGLNITLPTNVGGGGNNTGILLQNTVAATNVAAQNSPQLAFQSNGFGAGSSQPDQFVFLLEHGQLPPGIGVANQPVLELEAGTNNSGLTPLFGLVGINQVFTGSTSGLCTLAISATGGTLNICGNFSVPSTGIATAAGYIISGVSGTSPVCPNGTGGALTTSGCTGGGSGTVTSVAQTVPSWLTVGGSPITTSGTLAITPTSAQTSHQVIGTCNVATTFGPCSLVLGDLPSGLGLTANPLSQFAATTSAQLAGVLSDETGTGVAVFGTSPTIASATLSGASTVVPSGATITIQSGGTLTCAAGSTCPSGTGTVTSVAVTGANGIGVSGSPITSSGTIALSLGAITPTSTNGVSAATMAFLDATSSVQTQLNAKAPLASPALTGTPTVPTATVGTNTTQAASTAFVLANAATNPMTTLGDDTYGGASGVFTRLAGPTAPGVYTKTEIPASGAATAETYSLSGVKPNPQTATTYTYLSTDATQDRSGYTTFSNAASIAVTLPAAGSTGFGSNWVNRSCDIGVGTATITPTTSTISYTDGATYTSGASTMTLTTGQCATIYSDNTNYFANKATGGSGGTTTNALTLNNGGSGASSGSTFNGGSAVTLSYNTLGAAPTASPTFTGTNAAPLTLPDGSTDSSALANPTGTPTGTPSATGGTVASGTNFAKIIALDSGGRPTAAGTESASVTTSGGANSIAWAWTAVPNATSYQIWVSATTGTEAHFFTSSVNSFTQTLPIASGSQTGFLIGTNVTGGPNWFAGSNGTQVLPVGSATFPALCFGSFSGMCAYSLGGTNNILAFRDQTGAAQQVGMGIDDEGPRLVNTGAVRFMNPTGGNPLSGATFDACLVDDGGSSNTLAIASAAVGTGNCGAPNANNTGGNLSLTKLNVFGATSGSAVISASATGGTLNLGSTNATVTSAGALTVASCSGCGSVSLAFPLTVSGTVTSGGIPYFSSGTVLSSSTAPAAGTFIGWGGAGAAPTGLAATDNGTVIATTEGISVSPTSTSQVGLVVNDPSGTSVNLATFKVNATNEATIGNDGTVKLGSAPSVTFGTASGFGCTGGTAPSAVPAADTAFYCSASGQAAVMENNAITPQILTKTMNVNVTPVTVAANVTTDQNLMALTIPANSLNIALRNLDIWAAGVYSTAAASTAVLTFKVKLCTVSGCGSGTVLTLGSWATAALPTVTAASFPWNIHLESTTQTAGASSAYEAHGSLTVDANTTIGAADSIYADENAATVGTVDNTAQLFLQVTVAASAASTSNSFVERQLRVRVDN